jgi:hypothetical protein
MKRSNRSDIRPNADPGAAFFGRLGAITIGAVLAISFLSRGEPPLVSALGAVSAFFVGTIWVLLHGRFRRWLLFTSGWPQQIQTITFALTLIGIPLVLAILFELWLTR